MVCGWRLSILASCSIPTRFLLGFSLKFLWHFIVVSDIVVRQVGDWMAVMDLWWTWMDARTEAMRVYDEVYEVGQVVNHQCMRHKIHHLLLLYLRLRNLWVWRSISFYSPEIHALWMFVCVFDVKKSLIVKVITYSRRCPRVGNEIIWWYSVWFPEDVVRKLFLSGVFSLKINFRL